MKVVAFFILKNFQKIFDKMKEIQRLEVEYKLIKYLGYIYVNLHGKIIVYDGCKLKFM
ncbi:hypothetical protein J6TS2_28040 [Heyndrickxia sporothermodurans]|nr:hypothetical protein J6TS2_28040 [Heyndrickxia sporothermodurans]